MMFRWNLPTGDMPFEQRTPEAVLLELDGPQLITATDGKGKRYLGLFADRPDNVREMWLYAPITKLELEALFAGGVSMRNAMCKPVLDLVEYSDDKPAAMWRIAPEDVPAGILPTPDANLPIENGAPLLAKLLGKEPPKRGAPIFRCAGRPVRGSDISFGALSGIAGALQTLWSTIANDVLPPQTREDVARLTEAQTLRMSGSMAASFGIVVAPDHEEPFRKIADAYRTLARLSPETMQAAHLSPGVLAAYGDFLKTLSDLDAEVFAQLGDDAQAYIGAAYAARIRSSMRAVLSPPREELELPATMTGHGFFHAANIDKRTFVFFDAITNQDITGKIAKKIAEALKKPGQEIRVGNQTLYDVRIERKGARGKATLVQLYESKGHRAPD